MTAINLVGKTLGQYELREILSNGTIVGHYLAYQPRLKRSVLVQVLQAHLRDKPQARGALTRGAQLIAQLAHPHIVPIHDFGTHDEIDYVVMQHMSGGSLHNRIQQQSALGFQDAATICRQIGGALEYVHSRGFVHGDPSVQNIVFDDWGSAYLSDFIMAGFLAEMDDSVAGTLHYMAPERWQQQTPTLASDQYALAAIAYEMISGHPPFDGSTVAELYNKHLSAPFPPPQSYRMEIPPSVNAVLQRALAKAPADRYPTVSDFAREFETALKAAPQHLFISYSRRDSAYAQEVKTHLAHNGFEVWLDDAIQHGDQWFNQIHDAIKSCAAFVVIMTPDAEQSEWVQKEILLAKRYKKPIFPLLREGDEFAILIDVHYADVRNGDLPGVDFHRRVRRAVFGEA